MRKLLHVGLDVDDNSFHIGALCAESGEVFERTCKPNSGSLIKKLSDFQKAGFEFKLCYEATYIGYSLCRDLRKQGIPTEIIAPSLIPELASGRVKTDRLDALKLARYYSMNLLTPIHIPNEDDEQERDLVRGRSFFVEQRASLRKHILSTCRRHKIDYKDGNKSKQHWTKQHEDWLLNQVNQLTGVLKINFEIALRQLEKLDEGIASYESEIEKLSETEKYKKKKDSLNCFRGISTTTAMTLITEIGDVKRFKHPRQLTSYAGLDIIEYSSGGKENKFGITKMGNKRIRTAAVESCQKTDGGHVLSKRLKAQRKGQDLKVIDVADRCVERLRKKTKRLYEAGKPRNKIKVACAREFLGFVWEALNLVA